MNKWFLSFLLMWAVFIDCSAQKIPKVWDMVRIDDQTLMSAREVTIAQWIEFIIDNDFDETLFPDTSCLPASARFVYNDLMQRENFRYLKMHRSMGSLEKLEGKMFISTTPNFKMLADADTNYFALNIPVTGISFSQVQKFCRWKERKLADDGYKQMSVGLPTIEIYKRVIPNIDTPHKNCDCFVMNVRTVKVTKPSKHKNISKIEFTQGRGLVPVWGYIPTSLGLFNIEGNAAEMTSTEGISMGGSYQQTTRETYNDQSQPYTKPEGWLGFRYIATIKK